MSCFDHRLRVIRSGRLRQSSDSDFIPQQRTSGIRRDGMFWEGDNVNPRSLYSQEGYRNLNYLWREPFDLFRIVYYQSDR